MIETEKDASYLACKGEVWGVFCEFICRGYILPAYSTSMQTKTFNMDANLFLWGTSYNQSPPTTDQRISLLEQSSMYQPLFKYSLYAVCSLL